MNKSIQNFLAVVAGMLIGSLVNMGIISLGQILIPPPDGSDFSNAKSLANSMRMFLPHHFIFPFLAHALGTLVGCAVSIRNGKGFALRLALPVSTMFFLGGAYMVRTLPSPLWFNVLYLSLAYFPMAWLAAHMFRR